MIKKLDSNYLTESALIGALYAVFTLFGMQFSFGPIQFRVSEALTILPCLSSAAVPGLFVGCIVSNTVGAVFGATGAIDIVFGSIATLLAAISTRALRNIKFKGFPVLAMLPPVIFNALIVGAELSLFITPDIAFGASAFSVGVSELAVVIVLGIPLYFIVKKIKKS
jgi:uncharacterized membrane protein